jgi:hypothetical protein
MASLGIAPHVADKILNHQSGTISGVAAVISGTSSFRAARKRSKGGEHMSHRLCRPLLRNGGICGEWHKPADGTNACDQGQQSWLTALDVSPIRDCLADPFLGKPRSTKAVQKTSGVDAIRASTRHHTHSCGRQCSLLTASRIVASGSHTSALDECPGEARGRSVPPQSAFARFNRCSFTP